MQSNARRPTRAEINLDNLIHNFRVMREAMGADVAIMAAVKADAYGHGARQCAAALERAGAEWFGVAMAEEGITLRESGVQRPILCLGGFWEGQESSLIDSRLTPAVFRIDLIERLDRAARKRNTIIDYHVKIDTGMGRLGVPVAEFDDFLESISRFENVRLDGLMTHFAAADDADKREFTREQMHCFDEAVESARSRGHNPTWIHQANSGAAHALPQSRGRLVRLGGVLYGLWRDVTDSSMPPLDWLPVMSLHTRVAMLKTVSKGASLGYGCSFVTRRESRIATLPVGYEDGLRRGLSNRGQVILRGQIAPIVGRVSMDLTLIDVTDIEGASIGDEVVILGSQRDCRITAEEIAAQLGTISYEVTCGVSDRVPRVYTSGQQGESDFDCR
ncbi:MAG TPA: alanine racemase [Blastocatellia bacterium]